MLGLVNKNGNDNATSFTLVSINGCIAKETIYIFTLFESCLKKLRDLLPLSAKVKIAWNFTSHSLQDIYAHGNFAFIFIPSLCCIFNNKSD
jgi:hypothetical protein